MINLFKSNFVNLKHFYKVDKTINNVSLKSLTFQTRQTNWDGGSSIYMHTYTINFNIDALKILQRSTRKYAGVICINYLPHFPCSGYLTIQRVQ